MDEFIKEYRKQLIKEYEFDDNSEGLNEMINEDYILAKKSFLENICKDINKLEFVRIEDKCYGIFKYEDTYLFYTTFNHTWEQLKKIKLDINHNFESIKLLENFSDKIECVMYNTLNCEFLPYIINEIVDSSELELIGSVNSYKDLHKKFRWINGMDFYMSIEGGYDEIRDPPYYKYIISKGDEIVNEFGDYYDEYTFCDGGTLIYINKKNNDLVLKNLLVKDEIYGNVPSIIVISYKE